MDLRKYNLEKAIEAKRNYKEYAIYKYPCGKRHKTILLGSYEGYTQKLNELISNIHATYSIVELEQK